MVERSLEILNPLPRRRGVLHLFNEHSHSLPYQLLSSFRPSLASEDMAISPHDHSLGNAIHRGSLWRHRGTFQILRCY
jgi:hypothetical protein